MHIHRSAAALHSIKTGGKTLKRTKVVHVISSGGVGVDACIDSVPMTLPGGLVCDLIATTSSPLGNCGAALLAESINLLRRLLCLCLRYYIPWQQAVSFDPCSHRDSFYNLYSA